jgi:catechol 2,3-dioxygenase-like lactoylglutathione lyase family enzyme
MPTVNGVLETALYVRDMPRSIQFYRKLLEVEPLTADDRFAAFPIAGRQVLLLFKQGGTLNPITLPGGVIPPHDGTGQQHMAFAIAATELKGWQNWLRENGVAIESTVAWGGGGTSLYFRDPDDHLIEVATPGVWAIY